jgi:hypothetical protein
MVVGVLLGWKSLVGKGLVLAGRALRSGSFPGSGVGRRSLADRELLPAARELRSGGSRCSGVGRESSAGRELSVGVGLAGFGGHPLSMPGAGAGRVPGDPPPLSPARAAGRYSSTLEAA